MCVCAHFDKLSNLCLIFLSRLIVYLFFLQAKEQIQRERDEKSRANLLEMMDEIYVILKSNDFHASYFDRTAKPQQRMCDKEGWFRCRGAFDVECCLRLHTINPYASRGYRLLFGLWNLDHM